MRVRETLRLRFRRDEDGAVAIIVAISLLALFGAMAIAIDAGQLWVSRRTVSQDADAAALAAVVGLRDGAPCTSFDVQKSATDSVAENGGDTTRTTATLHGGCISGLSGKVTVEQERPTDFAFAQILPSIGNTANVYAKSVAEFGIVDTMTGLRPISMCVKDASYSLYKAGTHNTGPANNITSFATASGIAHRVDFDPAVVATSCNPPPAVSSAGNWGWLDFDGNSGDQCAGEPKGSELKDRIKNGYPCAVSVDLDGAGVGSDTADCTPTAGVDDCPAETGANASTKKALADELLCAPSTHADDCVQFFILIYDSLHDKGGSNLKYHPVGFAPVVLRDFHKITGGGGSKFLDKPGDHTDGNDACLSPSGLTPDAGWFCFEYLDDIDPGGRIGPPPAGTPVAKSNITIHLCGAEDVEACDLP